MRRQQKGFKTIEVVITLAIVIILGLVGLFVVKDRISKSNSNNKSENGKSALLSGKVYDGAEGFKITPPANWDTNINGNFGSLVVFSAPKPDTEAGNPFSANITVRDAPLQNSSLKEDLDEALAGEKIEFTDFKLLDVSEQKVGELPAYLSSISFTQSGYHLQGLQLITHKDNKVYVTTATVLASTATKYAEATKASLLSFR